MTVSSFNTNHQIILLAGLVISVLIALPFRKRPERKFPNAIRYVLIFVCLLAYPFSLFSWAKSGGFPSIEYIAPLHFCDFGVIICGFALLTYRPLLCELAYFWGIAGASQALLTPSLPESSTMWTVTAFFIHHWAIVAAAFILFLLRPWNTERPLWLAALRPLLFANIYFVIALVANELLDANYGYLSRKPDSASLLDHLGPWPVYIIWMQIISYILFLLLAIPLRKRP